MTEPVCPACGATLSSEAEVDGLCLGCLFDLALESPSLVSELDDEGEETLAISEGPFVQGAILGERYRVRALLGRGGMGEVWRAFDLKLRVDVALKTVLPQRTGNEWALEALRQEVRSARQVISPNVCRIFDLIEIDGRELVSMEYVDGITLLDILRMRGPLELTEAREIAAQFLAGLEAIHEAGLVHRDVKPENIMMTRSGRVVVMDFGVARALASGGSRGTVAGTPAYMPPEQARGDAVTSRSDVFSAAVVLAEMVAPTGLRTAEERRKVWEGAHRVPPEVGETPWTPVLTKGLAQIPDQRYPSASALTRAIEEVTLRAAGDEDLHPYPGLSSFTQEDAAYFFGRELEVEEMWKKLRRPHLLGLIGPSGSGKSSFLRAGLLSTLPTGWQAIVTTPGDRPFVGLGQALADELAGDQEALRELPRIREPDVAVALADRWRRRHGDVLLIVDQFEELFTQNRLEVQRSFSDLLGRLALEANVHVLLAMRDDFLFHCSEQPALSPMYSELTPLRPPVGTALRRALVQPALKCGYRFEDEDLVDEMVAEVGQERGALPLLAFAAARLWDHRDRDRGLLTREAYEHIGGVGGALALHAEAALERIGQERIAVVRELFRNLVTAQGTRAVGDHEELLSIFPSEDRDTVGAVLDALVDARLLVSYEAGDEAERKVEDAVLSSPPRRRRVEIVHESLLTAWPRLVRWRTQDEEGAQLRDQLRQVARLWRERGRPDDLLWTGTSFKEYELWRERYAGGLSDTERAFAEAMTSRAGQQRRRRRIALAAAFGLLFVVLGIIGFLWRQTDAARSRAEAEAARAESEARRAEASKLLALGQVEIEDDHTAALAHAVASLELADTPEARLFALRALAEGPPARVIEAEEKVEVLKAVFSLDGAWLSMSGHRDLWVVGKSGGEPRLVGSFASVPGYIASAFSADGDSLFALKYGEGRGEARIWSVPAFELRFREELDLAGEPWLVRVESTSSGFTALAFERSEPAPGAGIGFLYQPFSKRGEPGSSFRLVDQDFPFGVDGHLRWVAEAAEGDPRSLVLRPLAEPTSRSRLVGRHAEPIKGLIMFDREGRHVFAKGLSGEIRVWSIDSTASEPLSVFHGQGGWDDRWMQRVRDEQTDDGYQIQVWDLEAPAEARPLTWKSPGPIDETWEPDFTPDGRWLTTVHRAGRAVWPLYEERATVLPLPGDQADSLDMDVAFTSDGRLVSAARGEVREWDLSPGAESRVLATGQFTLRRLALDPAGRFAAASVASRVLIVPFDDEPTRDLEGVGQTWALAVDAEGRRIAAASAMGTPEAKSIRIWDLASGAMRALDPVDGTTDGFSGRQNDLAFLPDERMVSVGDGGLRLWDLGAGTSRVLAPSHLDSRLAVYDQGRQVAYVGEDNGLAVADLESGRTLRIASHGDGITAVGTDLSASVLVSGSEDGTVRVGPIDGGEPHLLLGHTDRVRAVAVSPDGRRIASIAEDNALRLWPMPDLNRPPLHILPHEALLAELRSITNVLVVKEEESSTGWSVKYGPFPGWGSSPVGMGGL